MWYVFSVSLADMLWYGRADLGTGEKSGSTELKFLPLTQIKKGRKKEQGNAGTCFCSADVINVDSYLCCEEMS